MAWGTGDEGTLGATGGNATGRRILDGDANVKVGRTLASDSNSAYHIPALPLPERALIARIRRRARQTPAVVAGIGDDCAVLRVPAGHEIVVTTDFSLEGVHFRRQWHPPESVGHRCLARGLSDIAAMGGDPVAAFLSLALPRKLPQRWVDRFFDGLLKLAAKFRVPFAGGDTAQSPGGILADLVVVGSVPRGKAVLRSNARPGDRIYVSGTLGGSAAALDLLFSKRRRRLRPDLYPDHFFPTPQVKLGQTLRQQGIASAMIDISDGFSIDLAHICEESGVGAEIYESSIPRARIAQVSSPVDLRFALHGGEDYPLLFTAPKRQAIPAVIEGVAITEVGVITRSKDILLVHADRSRSKLRPLGWEHFRKPPLR
jgi:thiamine-monophosphate kinase